jgi:hypothetical protein
MHCTKCKHIDRRNGECLELVPYVWCHTCRRRYLINQIRCPRCQLGSQTLVATLERDDVDFIAGSHCPLTDVERAALVKAQNAPLMGQRELF